MDAKSVTCQRAKEDLNTITVTGNVLLDCLTDLFAILELGTSAKMFSAVPMLAGGGMYERGAGGSSPKHVKVFQKDGHLRWHSLGEYLALTCALEDLAEKNPKAGVLAAAWGKAVGTFLVASKNPSCKRKEVDNRGSHYRLAPYWVAGDASPQSFFEGIAEEMKANEGKICQNLIDCQGTPVHLGGYYHVDKVK
jgi:isocitrate dehydrogenase